MKISIAELSTLSQRLQNALDSNYNVLDMPTILDVIQVLEGTQITKEQLETTRLAKHINQLRRNKSLNELLARRLKNLIKKWREMVIPTGGQQLLSQPHLPASVSCISPPAAAAAVTSSTGVVKLLSGTNLTNGSRSQYSRTPITGISSVPVGYRPATTAITTSAPSAVQRKSTKPALPHATLSGSVVRPVIVPLTKPYQRNNGGGNLSATTKPGPISFTNLISQAEANQKHGSTSGSSSTTGSAKRTTHYDDRSLSPMQHTLPKIPRLGQPSDRLVRTPSPFDLFGGGPISQQPPPQLFQDKDDNVTITARSHDALLLDDSNSRKNFNGSAVTRPFRITSSSMDIASDSNSFPAIDKSSSSFALHPTGPDGTTTSAGLASQSSMTAKHKKHKKEKKKSRTDRKLTDPFGKADIRTDLSTKGDFRCLRADDTSKAGVSPQYDAPNSLSSDSNTLFNSTTSNLTASGPVLTTETTSHQVQLHQSHWRPITAMSSNRTHSSELTFSGKFTKSDDTDTIINIDSSSSDYDTHFRPVSVPAAFMPKLPSQKRKHDLIASASAPSFSPVIVHESRSCSPVPLGSMENSLDVMPIDRAYRSTASTNQASMVAGSLSEDTITGGESSSLPPAGDITVGTIAPLMAAEPKKRGRKKGSNGADRRLADAANSTSASGGNAFESSLSGLKNKIDLMRTGGAKKVKSTQELIAGLQNRGGKVEDVDTGGQFMQRSRMSSPDSDSQTDSTDVIRSTTATVSTPESVFNDYESSNAAGKKYVSAAARFIAGATIPLARSIQEELTELSAQLHPIDPVAVALAIEASTQDVVPCTCRLIEVEDLPLVEATIPPDESNKPALQESIAPVTTKPKAPDPIHSSPPAVPPPTPTQPPPPPPPPQVLPPAAEPLRIVAAPKKPVKSIFDLDYDEDEDPIHKFAVVVHTAPAVPFQQPVVKPIEHANNKTVIDQPVELVAIAEALPPPLTVPTGPQLPRFEIIEDPNCLAARHYVTQKRDICDEHLEALHNFHVPNINGNWDNGGAALDIEPDNDADGNEIEPDLYERIVPTFNHMCVDRIPKNLRHITFSPEQRDYKRRALTPPEVIEVATDANLRFNEELDQTKTEDETIQPPANGNVPLNVIDPYVPNDQIATDYDAGYDDEYGNVVNEPDIGGPVLDDTDLDDYDVPIAAYEPMTIDFDVPAVDLFPSAPTQPSLWLATMPSPPRTSQASALNFMRLSASSASPPPPSSTRRSSSKVKYKIRKCSTDLARDDNTESQTTAENSCATVPGGGSTKIIIKLSRQLTNCSEEDEEDDDDDDEDDEDDDEDDYEDEEDENDEEDECDEDEEEELITVPDNETNLVAAAVTNDLETCNKTIVLPQQCDDDDVANNNDEQIGDAKPFIDAIDTIAEHEEIVTTTSAIESEPVEQVDLPSDPTVTESSECESAQPERAAYERLTATNYGQMPSFDNLTDENVNGRTIDGARFREWHEVVRVRSYNDELLTILPYVVID